eukprot:1177507-Prorocentrum_minimum.AAC.2
MMLRSLAICLPLVRGAESGEEVFNTFGRHSNGTLIHRYGFAEADNELVSVQVEAGLVDEILEAAGSKCTVSKAAKALQERLVDEILEVAGSKCTVSKAAKALQERRVADRRRDDRAPPTLAGGVALTIPSRYVGAWVDVQNSSAQVSDSRPSTQVSHQKNWTPEGVVYRAQGPALGSWKDRPPAA